MMRNGSLSGQGSDVPSSIEYISEIIYETPPTKVHSIPPFPDSATATGVPVVRTEEALIVIFVLILWVAAIALFFNRWGKIRMLEPYQPKFHQEHRSSCPMVDINHPSMAQRSSFSKFNVNCLEPPPHFAAVPPTYRSLVRPRQNSVFVGSSNNMFAVQINPPRKTKSAVDIKSLVLNEKPTMSKSMLPMSSERRPSCSTLGIRRSSCLLSPRPSCDRRPSSCSEFLPGSKDRHTYCNEFLSPMHSFDRRTSASGDYLSPHRDQRRPSFNNVIAQVTAERRPSSSMLRISNV